MPPDLSGGASACVRDIRRGLVSSGSVSSSVDSAALPISITNNNATATTTVPAITSSILSTSSESDYLSSSSISSVASSVDSPPQYTDLFPPSPPVTPLGFPSRTVEQQQKAGNDVSLIALSRGLNRVSLGARTLSTCSTSSGGSSLSLVSSIADTDVSTADLDAENDTQSIDSSSPSEIAHDLAATIFPSLDLSGRAGVECSAIPVEVTSGSEEWAAWDGFVLDHARYVENGQEEEDGEVRTLYVKSRNYDGVNARENVIALLELADEAMECDSVVICLDKTNPDLSSTLHSLLYVGGSIVHADASQGIEFMHSADYVLIGLDL